VSSLADSCGEDALVVVAAELGPIGMACRLGVGRKEGREYLGRAVAPCCVPSAAGKADPVPGAAAGPPGLG
jgi:hypothetical protein